MKCIQCDEEATSQIQVTGEPEARKLCMQHGELLKRQLDSVLTPYQFTSILHRDPSEKELLADSYGKLQQVHTENEGLRKAVTRLERELNECDQERQRLGVELGRTQLAKQDSESLSHTLLDQYVTELAECHELLDSNGIPRPGATQERVEGSEVEPLTGMGAGADPNGPTS